ncbi:MAG: hypothetical protein RLZZ77_669 [Bacteroidota bacterium]
MRRPYCPPCMKKIAFLTLALFITLVGNAQFSTGTWRDHLPYTKAIDLCIDKDELVWVATSSALFTFNQYDNDVQRVSKVNRLSDVGITAIEYIESADVVLVGYENGNIDVLWSDGQYNIPDIKISSVVGDKSIYNIKEKNNFVYLSTGFGIVVLDLSRREVKSTYLIGELGAQVKVTDVEMANDTLFAATELGLQAARLDDPFIANYENWSLVTNVPADSVSALEVYQNNLIGLFQSAEGTSAWRKDLSNGTWLSFLPNEGLHYTGLWSDPEWMTISGTGAYRTYHFDFNANYIDANHDGIYINARNAAVDKWGNYWVADNYAGLLFRKYNGEKTVVYPTGPAQAAVRKITAYNDNMWIAHGGIDDSWSNNWNKAPMSGFVDEHWKIVAPGEGINPLSGVNDFMDVAVDPLNNNHVMFGSWEEGLVELKNGNITIYSPTAGNSTIEGSGFTWAEGWTGIAGVAYDINGVLWCSNNFCNTQLHSMDRNGNFHGFSFTPTLADNGRVGEIVAAQTGYVYMIVPNIGILALDYNGTLSNENDDNYKLLNDEEGNGGLPSKDVFCMEEDVDGELWVGTVEGIAVFYNQAAIFEEEGFDAEQILISQDGNFQYLLETEAVTAIKIDGGNRKWVGTQNSGVFLFSDDGLEQIYHFTAENSPLLSNNIYDIAVNQSNGEVFFATDKGIVSFFGTATNFDLEMKDVSVYPNPVRPEFEGNVTIDGLAYDTNVRITDLQGNLVYETNSEGGRAVWNGKKLNGERPASGVYLVFAANSDGTVDNVGKITFIR